MKEFNAIRINGEVYNIFIGYYVIISNAVVIEVDKEFLSIFNYYKNNGILINEIALINKDNIIIERFNNKQYVIDSIIRNEVTFYPYK